MDVKDWLLAHNKIKTSVLHLEEYYGEWKTQACPEGKQGFHIILKGECWMELQNQQRTLLQEGDILFFFHEIPFYLFSSDSSQPTVTAEGEQATDADKNGQTTHLLCGLFNPETPAGKLLFALLPDIILFRKHGQTGNKLRPLLELLKQECRDSAQGNSNIITHLTDAILYYIVSKVSEEYEIDGNLLRATEDHQLTKLMIEIIRTPAERWSLEDMADLTFMSRSTFIRRMVKVTGYTPNLVVSKLRIYAALNMLRRGHKIEEIYNKVGYESLTGFYNAFKRITGMAPGSYSDQLSTI